MDGVFTLRELMAQEFAEPNAEGYVYVMRAVGEEEGAFKIGRSSDPWKRLEQLSRQTGRELELVDYWPSDDCVSAEKAAHRRFAGSRLRGEWFHLSWLDVDRVGEIVRALDPGTRSVA